MLCPNAGQSASLFPPEANGSYHRVRRPFSFALISPALGPLRDRAGLLSHSCRLTLLRSRHQPLRSPGMNVQLSQEPRPPAVRDPRLRSPQQPAQHVVVAGIDRSDDLLDQLRQRPLLVPQAADQSARLIKGERLRRPRDQSCGLSFLPCCGFPHQDRLDWWGLAFGRNGPFPSEMRHLRHFRGLGLSPWVPRPEPDRRHGRIAHRPCGLRHQPQPQEHVSPAGRWRSRLSPPPPLKFRVHPGLRLRVCLGSRFKSPSPVPRNCRCAPGALRYNAARSIRLVARKRNTQRGAALSGPPFPFGLRRPPLVGQCATQAKHSGPRLDRRPAIQP